MRGLLTGGTEPNYEVWRALVQKLVSVLFAIKKATPSHVSKMYERYEF